MTPNSERPNCSRCIWFLEATVPRDSVFCMHQVHRGEITDLDMPRCGGVEFKPCEPEPP